MRLPSTTPVDASSGCVALVAQWLRSASPNVLPHCCVHRVPTALPHRSTALRHLTQTEPSLRYDWDFGDGTTGTGATANHNYAAEGTYTVKLKVTDNSGGTNEVSQ